MVVARWAGRSGREAGTWNGSRDDARRSVVLAAGRAGLDDLGALVDQWRTSLQSSTWGCSRTVGSRMAGKEHRRHR